LFRRFCFKASAIIFNITNFYFPEFSVILKYYPKNASAARISQLFGKLVWQNKGFTYRIDDAAAFYDIDF